MNQYELKRDGVQLAYWGLGGSGPPILLLHGLAGYAGEWVASAQRLSGQYRVFALDQRGHGASERRPSDLSRAVFVEDCAATIRHLELGPVTLVGQSMGASTAMLTAAAHPDLVRSLVIIEGSPDGPDSPDPDPDSAREIRALLAAWPVPFPDQAAAHRFFHSKGFNPGVWTAGLELRDDGLWPRWEVDVLVDCITDLGSRNYWPQWRAIQCPTLVVLGGHGMFPPGHGEDIVKQLPGASVITIPDAGHDVHLDAPQAWTEALQRTSTR
jgi:pimeloyl-ACP methyl ester carboxylesterase